MTTEPTPAPSTSITEKPAEPPVAADTSITAAAPALAPAPATGAAPSAWFKKSDYLLLLLVLVLSFLVASFTATNSDIWLHLAIGERLSDGTFQFGVDPFSWATEAHGDNGTPTFWVHQSWLYSWLFYQLYHLVGGFGLVLGKAVLFTAAIALLSRIGRAESNRWFIVICLTMAALAISPRLLLQPTVLSLLFLSITLYVLDRAGVFSLVNAQAKPACARCLWWLPPLFALWANLDVWFILGPLVLALCWAATGLARWYKGASPVPGKTLGLVLGVGLAACLLNPFHVRVFQLPPELAYIALSLTEPLKIPLPDDLVAAGRTLRELRKADPSDAWTLSPLAREYWSSPRFGYNVAGLAFYPLFLLGLLSFTLVALVRPQPGAPTLQVSRFLVWLAFGIMALALYRTIPFFALVAAPLTAVTLGEFLRWQQVSNAIAAARQDRGMNLARFVSFPFLLILLYMAWPGWLHVMADYNSQRRVAWDIREDASMRRAAEALQTLKKNGECRNVFNVGADFAHYCANFAPDVKCFMDTRFALFAQQTAAYARARKALLEQKQPEDWETLFQERAVDQVVLGNFVQNLRRDQGFGAWLVNTGQWRQRFGDGRTMVFSLAKTGRPWPEMTCVDDWNRQAFGVVPEDRRPPKHGTPAPAPLGVWELYAQGIGVSPTEAVEARLDQTRFIIANNLLMNLLTKAGGPLSSDIGVQSMVAASQGLPGKGGAGGIALLLTRLHVRPNRYHPTDLGPPALPILMQRAARLAIAANPLDVQSRLTLIDANETVRRKQEDYWINYEPGRRPHPAPLRDRMRSLQKLTDLSILLQLPTLAPQEAYTHHEALAEIYFQQNMLDLALDHLQEGLKALQEFKAHGKNLPKDPKELDSFIKQQRDKVEAFDAKVRSHLARWKDLSAGKPPLVQAERALNGEYVELDGEKRRTYRLGLAKKALEILLPLQADALKEGEQYARLQMLLELLLATGRAETVAETLREEAARRRMGPLTFAQYQILAGGALGDFAMFDEGAATIEKQFRAETQELIRVLPQGILFGSFLAPEENTIGTVAFHTFIRLKRLQERQNELCNVMTLRGIAALESGDTKKARDIFESIFIETGADFRFSERPIAVRYRQLLNEQWPK
jgi:hypothetical protein